MPSEIEILQQQELALQRYYLQYLVSPQMVKEQKNAKV